MKVVRSSGQERDVPRGVLGGPEISAATAGSHRIYLGRYKVPAGSQSRPHYHAKAESAVLMLTGRLEIKWGESFGESLTIEPGDMLYVPPNETHVVRNMSDTEPAEYVVARDSAADDSVEVAWSG